MDNERLARWFFGLTSALVTFGIVLQLQVAITNDNGFFEAVPARIVNVLSYFTVQSNILVALTTGLLAVRLDRRATWFRVLRLSAVIGITITGVDNQPHIGIGGVGRRRERVEIHSGKCGDAVPEVHLHYSTAQHGCATSSCPAERTAPRARTHPVRPTTDGTCAVTARTV